MEERNQKVTVSEEEKAFVQQLIKNQSDAILRLEKATLDRNWQAVDLELNVLRIYWQTVKYYLEYGYEKLREPLPF